MSIFDMQTGVSVTPRPRKKRWRIPPHNGCQSYWQGHNPHWIEVFNVINPAEKVEAAVEFLEGVTFEVIIGEDRYVWLNHQPERLIQSLAKAALHAPEDPILVIVEHPTILVRSPDGRFIFNMAEGEMRPCNKLVR